MEMLKAPLRKLLRTTVTAFPVRGRFRLVQLAAPLLAPPPGRLYAVNGVNMALDQGLFMHQLIYYGLYEPRLVNFLRRQLREGDIVLDPGANIGYISAVCLGLVGSSGHVHSFEPSPTAYGRISAHNNLAAHANWSLRRMALTDHAGEGIFNDTPRVMKAGYAALETAATPVDSIPGVVELTSVDTFCQEQGIDHVRFLKLDIEGSELPALRGAAGMLARRAIDMILVETTTQAGGHRNRAEAIDQLLREAGYRSFHLNPSGRTKPINVLKDVPYREDIIWMAPSTWENFTG